MPAFCAAFGSFHPKSSVMYFVSVLTTVRVLPLLLTLTLIRSSTLTVSTFGVRSYSDQRYWSMQTSGSGQASSTSELTAGLPAFCTGSIGLVAANSTGDVAGCGIGGDSDNTALPLAISATETLCSPSAVARGDVLGSRAHECPLNEIRPSGGGSFYRRPGSVLCCRRAPALFIKVAASKTLV